MMKRGQRALIYTRISRDDSGEGAALARQEEDCRKLCDMRGWQVVGIESDLSISAYSGKKRPGWDRVVEAMRSRACDVVVVWALDRVTRRLRDLADLLDLARETGVGVATVTGDLDLSTDTGRMVAGILGSVAQGEVERKGTRQRRANEQRAANGDGWRTGWRTFGYARDLTVIPEEAALIRQAADDLLAGVSLKEIARRWKASGIATARNTKGAEGWTSRGVKLVLTNPKIAGQATYRGKVVGKGKWEPIISEDTLTLLRVTLTDPARLSRTSSAGRQAQNLLTGIAKCARCGGTVQAGSRPDGRGGRRPAYLCAGNCLATPRSEADALVRSAVTATLLTVRPGAFAPQADGSKPEGLLREAERIRERQAELGTAFAQDRIDLTAMEAASASLAERLADIESALELSDGLDPLTVRAASVQDFDKATLSEQRAWLSRHADVKLYPRGRGKRNVPIGHQVSVVVTVPGRAGKPSREIVARDDVPAEVKAKASA